MARSGKFGRLPRAAPNIGSVIAALAREMAAQRDRNILEAWRSGGLVDGKPVKDGDLIKHFEERRDGFATDDPMWDYYNNLALTYGFSIEESKMTLKYADGTASESQMSAFYRTWAGKIPKDTELYRTLMRSAAEYLDRARARGAAGAAAAKAAAYAAADTAAYNQYQADYDTVYSLMEEAARREGIIVGNETLLDLRLTDQNDHARFLGLFDKIAAAGEDSYLNPIREQLEAAGFGGLNYGMFVDLSSQNVRGLEARGGLASQYGYADRAAEFAGAASDANYERLAFRDIDDFAALDTARDQLNTVYTNASSDPWAVDYAMDNYARTVTLTRDRAENPDDIGLLNNELNGLSGAGIEEGFGPTIWDPGKTSIDDAAGFAEARLFTTNFTNAVAQGLGVGTQVMETASDGSKVQVWRLLPVTDPILQDPSRGTVSYQKMGVPGGQQSSQPVFIQHHDIRVTAKGGIDPRSGAPQTDLKPTSDERIGYYWTVGVGNNQQTFYAIYTDEGTRFLNYNPFQAPPDISQMINGKEYRSSINYADGEMANDGLSDLIIELSLPSAGGGQFDPYLVMGAKEMGGDELNANNPGWALTQRGIENTFEPTRLAFLGTNPTTEAARIRNTWANNPERMAAELQALQIDYADAANKQNMVIAARGTKVSGVQQYSDLISPFLPPDLGRNRPGPEDQEITFEEKLSMRFGVEGARTRLERSQLAQANQMADEVLAREGGTGLTGMRNVPSPLDWEAVARYMQRGAHPSTIGPLRSWLGEKLGEDRVSAALPPIRLPTLPPPTIGGTGPGTGARAREGLPPPIAAPPPPPLNLPPIKPPKPPPLHPVDLGDVRITPPRPPQSTRGGYQEY